MQMGTKLKVIFTTIIRAREDIIVIDVHLKYRI